MIHEQIKKEIQDALRSRDTEKLSVLRGMLSAFTNALVEKGKKPDGQLNDDEALEVIRRAVKQRQDAIDQFNRGNRKELAEKEAREQALLLTYLPPQMSEAEITAIVKEKKESLGITDKTKMGMLIGAVMKEVANKADGTLVRKVVEAELG